MIATSLDPGEGGIARSRIAEVEAATQPAASVARRSPSSSAGRTPTSRRWSRRFRRLTLPVMQELNARVDLDREQPAAVATQYLQEEGYVE